MRILYVFRSLAHWGGIERILVDKMNHLVTMFGYEVFMLTTDQGNHPVPYQLEEGVHLEDLNIRFHQQYRYHGLKRLLTARRMSRLFKQRLSDRLQKIQPDVIVCTTANYVDINIIAELRGSTPLIVESHSIYCMTMGQKGLRHRYADYMYRKGLSKAQMIVALTEGDAVEWRKAFPHVCVIPNMVHLNEGKLSTLDHKRVLWVGRFDYQKRPMEMIEIWTKVYPQFPDWHLDIYGEGEQHQQLEDAVQSLGMNIHIHQPTDRIFDVYRNSSILVSTSLFEPFGLVIPEAMSCGLPVVAYNSRYGPANIVDNGKNGLLVSMDDQQSFAKQMIRLMLDIGLRQQIGEAAVISAQSYSAEKIMPQWQKLLLCTKSQ